jgi:hypothetical protein
MSLRRISTSQLGSSPTLQPQFRFALSKQLLLRLAVSDLASLRVVYGDPAELSSAAPHDLLCLRRAVQRNDNAAAALGGG